MSEIVISHNREGLSQEDFTHLQRFYNEAKVLLGEYLPDVSFEDGRINQEEKFVGYKKIEELSKIEFTVDFVAKLLDLQEKLGQLLPPTAGEHPSSNFLNFQFKKDVLYNPISGKLKISGVFGVADIKQAETESIFSLLRKLQRKMFFVLERSAAKEFVFGKNVHWTLDKSKLEKGKLKGMALTFDDGPNEQTLELLDILKRQNIKATFFLVGSLVPGREHIVERIVEEGHDIGVHEWGQEGAHIKQGWKEYSKRFVGPREDLGSVKNTAEIIKKVAGVTPVIGRVAGVHATIDSMKEFELMKLKLIHGSPYDVAYMPPNTKETAEALLLKAIKGNGNGKIRIFHIGQMQDGGKELRANNVNKENGEYYPPDELLKMIEKYIQRSKEEGFEFVLVKDYI